MTVTPFRALGLHHAQLMVPHGGEAEARRFYLDVLGLVELEKPPALAVRGGFWLTLGAQQLHVGVEHADAPPASRQSRAHVAIEVDDLDAATRHLEAHGVEVIPGEPVQGMARAELRDPFGNRLELCAEPHRGESE